MDFSVLILGTDANSYYMARCCYEKYHIKPYVIGQKPLVFTTYTNILQASYKDMWNEDKFIEVLKEFKKEHKEKVLLICTNETYTEFISKNKELLKEDFYFICPEYKTILSLTNKELFYKTYQGKLPFAKSIYHDVNEELDLKDITFPVVVKPANVVLYNHISFQNKNKIYKVLNEEDLRKIIKDIKDGGYTDKLIIQEFILGGDDNLFDAVVYVNSKGKAEFMSFAQIGLQERTRNMVGNAAVLINGFNTTSGDVNKMVQTLKEFIEGINYRGFAEVDMKYDKRDNTFKVLEINARQGRSSYYLTGLGKNLVEVLVNDLLKGEEGEFKLLKDKVLLSFVPKGIVKKYITNEEYKKEVLKLWPSVIRPMHAKCDKNFKRFLMLKKRDINYYKEYKNGYWR